MLDSATPWAKWYSEGTDPAFVPELTTVNRHFARFVADYAGRTAFDYNGHVLTYADFGEACLRVADALRRRGIVPGDVVGLYLPNTVFHPIFFYGALLAGATVTHLSPLDALRELEHKVRDSGAKVVVSVTMPPFAPRIQELLETGALPGAILCDDAVWGGPSGATSEDPRVTAYEDFIAGADAASPAHEAQPEDVALLQYTGGTTGLPKAAILDMETQCINAENDLANVRKKNKRHQKRRYQNNNVILSVNTHGTRRRSGTGRRRRRRQTF